MDNIQMTSQHRDRVFRVFVSSTFRDMKNERDALQKEVFPKLREYCRQRNARFQAVDLRWGVSEESSCDQQTMPICLRELERCQKISLPPNFIVLLGQRYGWIPLPACILADEFEQLLKFVSKKEDWFLLGQWYCMDRNAVPCEYILLPREKELRSEHVWRSVEDRLREILQNAATQAFAEDDLRRRKYFESATHQEINHVFLSDELDLPNHALAYFREIRGASTDGSAAEYIDTGIAAENLRTLRDRIQRHLPKDHYHTYESKWTEDGPATDLKAFCERIRKDLERIIDAELNRFHAQSALDRERDAHREFGLQRCQNFVGRGDVLDRINSYLASDERTPLVIHGPSGFGKTSLIAEAWRRLATSDEVTARFIGATPESADLRSLLRNLCQELGVESPPEDMNELVGEFQERLSDAANGKDSAPLQPTVVFLDALDQLNDTNSARMLYWLPRELAPGIKLVLSVLDDKNQRECFDIASRIWPDTLVPLGPLSLADGEEMLNRWLTDAGRQLQPEQKQDALAKFTGDGTPLFLKLAFEQARRWKSWEGLPFVASGTPGLSDSIERLMEDLFDHLQHEHRESLVAAALKYIAAARNGLTEDELMDVLSCDKAVMKDFIQNSPTEREKRPEDRLKELPQIIWSRLHADIGHYMTRRRADGTVIMNFYHRQVAAAVCTKYLIDERDRLAAHEHLAMYFDSLDYWAESLEAQRARAKRLPPTPRPANVRKVVELPYHRLETAKLAGKDDPKSPHWDAVADLLTDWQFLEAKTEADPNLREQEFKEGADKVSEVNP